VISLHQQSSQSIIQMDHFSTDTTVSIKQCSFYRQHCTHHKVPVYKLLTAILRLWVTHSTDGGEIWHEGPVLHAKFCPHRYNDDGIGPQKLRILLKFDEISEYKRPSGAYPLHNFP